MMRNSAAAAFVCGALAVLPAAAPAQQAQTPAPGPAGRTQAPAPEASPNDIDGEQMFGTLCGFCHQDGGRKGGKAPKLAGSKRSDEYLIERIKKGKPGAMPAFGKVFSEGQIYAILAYIRGLDE
jgi:mono/diheme cytochrome c family protein